jgi:hypothetical protein
MTLTFLVLASCIGFGASFRVRNTGSADTQGPLEDFFAALSSNSEDIQTTCASESKDFFELFKSDRFKGMIDMPDGILDRIEAQAKSRNERTQFEAVSMMSDIAAEVARQGEEFEAQAKGQASDPKTLWTQNDGVSVWKGAERCEILLALASGHAARSIAQRRYVFPHERPEFRTEWDSAVAAKNAAKLQQMEQTMVDGFTGMMEKCSIVTQGKIRTVDGINIDYGPYSNAYSVCGQAIQGEREDRRNNEIFPSPWWEKYPACIRASAHADSVVQARTKARAQAQAQRSSDTYVPLDQRNGVMLEVEANTTDTNGNNSFALVEVEGKSDSALATGDNIFFRIYQSIQQSGVLTTTLVVLKELAQMGFKLVYRITSGVFSVIKGTLSLVVGVLLAFPRWLLFARDKHKTFGIGVADDGLKVWPWCWVVPREPHSLFNKRMCR